MREIIWQFDNLTMWIPWGLREGLLLRFVVRYLREFWRTL